MVSTASLCYDGGAHILALWRETVNTILRWLPLILGLAFGFPVLLYVYQNQTNGRIRSSGRLRHYLLHVPESYDPEQPAPLVVSLHGYVQWPAHQQAMTGWNALADQHGFLVVYPQGTGFPLRWRAQSVPSGEQGMARDIQFIADLLDHLCDAYSIDEERIYINGMSNGAGMTHLLACRMPERIAAIGGVAGAYLYQPAPDEPGRPVPLIAFHGTDDPVVPFDGGPNHVMHRRFRFPSVEGWAAGWAERNGCAETPEEMRKVEDVRRLRYAGCREDAGVVLYIIEGGGHTWPGGSRLPVWLTGHTSRSVDATSLMWSFYCRHTSGLP